MDGFCIDSAVYLVESSSLSEDEPVSGETVSSVSDVKFYLLLILLIIVVLSVCVNSARGQTDRQS